MRPSERKTTSFQSFVASLLASIGLDWLHHNCLKAKQDRNQSLCRQKTLQTDHDLKKTQDTGDMRGKKSRTLKLIE